ncbi:hypothetical protein PHYPSEUDO_005018 [Phytophthora pseudosyringae]|uniref:TKL protein kinase n=1 Tax=Phytophthora pseudosyringae TaxID=221518 RepID=A0A8T1VQR9_9STRA|nr:hypothetical protein PHYPSEUDO_005018 [Phytophthora pseudosyringae]
MLSVVQHNALLVTLLAVIAAFILSVPAESFAGTVIYSGGECSGTPLVVSVDGSIDCEAVECVFFMADGETYSSATTCESTDRQTYVAEAFIGANYVMIEKFTTKCKLFMGTMAFLATGECQVYDEQGDNYVVAEVNEDGSASLGIYNDSSCSGSPFLGYEPDSETVSSHSCYKNDSVIYARLSATNTSVSTRSSSQTARSTRASSNSGGSLVGAGSNDSDRGIVGIRDSSSTSDEGGSQAGENATVSITPPESSGGINTGAIVGTLVAYVILCMAACILCMDRMERFVRRLGLRR